MRKLLETLAGQSDDEKGDRGRVGVVAGSIDHAGPPALVGQAAMRTGSDVAKVVTSEEIFHVVASHSENLMVNRYTGEHLSVNSVSKATTLGEWGDALVIGPGLAEPDPDAIERIVDDVTVPQIVDADAIGPAVAADLEFPDAVFTPDATEIGHIERQYASLESFSEETGATVVATGEEDVVIADGERWTNYTGTPAMTVAGTGDVLAGIVASLLGQRLDGVDAAKLGTWIVGQAGERATRKYGNGLLATDIIEEVPTVME